MAPEQKNSTLTDILLATKGIAKVGLATAVGVVTYNYVPQLYEYIQSAPGSEIIPDSGSFLSCAAPAFAGAALIYTFADSGINNIYQSLKSKKNTLKKTTR